MEAVDGPADLLVNCTAVGMQALDDPWRDLPLAADGLRRFGCVVDLVYREGGTDLIAAAARADVATVDGIDVLTHQGACSLEIWAGRPAPLEQMRAAARALA